MPFLNRVIELAVEAKKYKEEIDDLKSEVWLHNTMVLFSLPYGYR